MESWFSKYKIVIIGILVVALATVFIIVKNNSSEKIVVDDKSEEIVSATAKIAQTVDVKSSQTPIPTQLNLTVPFTSQAPKANWDQVHEESCEEAAILMAQKYFENQKFSSPQDADNQILNIVDWERENLGFFESTDAEQTAEVARRYLGLKAEVVSTPSSEEIKKIIASGKLIAIPEAGQKLKNPYYKAPGPLYHMLLIKGFTANKFITNDPGTRRGENYSYDFNIVLDANHDYNSGDVLNGAKKAIVIWK